MRARCRAVRYRNTDPSKPSENNFLNNRTLQNPKYRTLQNMKLATQHVSKLHQMDRVCRARPDRVLYLSAASLDGPLNAMATAVDRSNVSKGGLSSCDS